MTDKKDETGRGRPGEGPRRPYATIDLQATEVGGKAKARAGAPGAGERPDGRTAKLPPPGPRPADRAWTLLSDGAAAARRWGRKVAESNGFPSHVAAGVAGAVLTLAATALVGLFAGGDQGARLSADLSERLAAAEQALDKRAAALADEVGAKLAATDARVAGLEERAQAVGDLTKAQARLEEDAKALAARVDATALTERLTKLETALAALSAADKSGRAELAEGLTAKLNDLEKLANAARETAEAGATRLDRDLAALRSAAGDLGRHIETLKAEVEQRFEGVARSGEIAPVLAKLAEFERDLRAFVAGEQERVANDRRVLLALEIANLKRAMERGGSFAQELAAARKVAGSSIDLAPLERHSRDGVPALAGLIEDFRRTANAAIDAEREPSNASVFDRLMAGAWSIVRIRKVGHDPDDTSAEAVVGRMEAALQDGNIAEVIAQGGKLPPKAARAAEPWLRRLQARQTADRALADIEAVLKASLAAPPLPEPKR